MKAKVEASKPFADDWIAYESRITGSREYILWPAVRDVLSTRPLRVVADLGCGTGDLTRRFDALGAEKTYGIDVNAHLISRAVEEAGLSIQFLKCDLSCEEIPLGDASCDVVFSNCLLMHLPLQGIAYLAHQIKRVLKRDGLLIIAVTHYEWACENYKIEAQTDDEIITCRMSSDKSLEIREYFRDSKWYLNEFSKAGFAGIAEKALIIPSELRLEERYRQRSGKSLFSIFIFDER